MSARVYFMKRVKDYKDMSIMSPQDEQWRLYLFQKNDLIYLAQDSGFTGYKNGYTRDGIYCNFLVF